MDTQPNYSIAHDFLRQTQIEQQMQSDVDDIADILELDVSI